MMSCWYEEAAEAFDRGAVESGGTLAAGAEAQTRPPRPPLGDEPGLSGRHFVDFAERGRVAFPAGGVSFPLDLLATAETVGGARSLAGSLARDAGRAGRGRLAEVGRDLSRRQLCGGEKGGAAVGKTKRGKGTKWMVLVDGEGLPLGVRLESASPAEVTLAEATLAQVRVPRCHGRPRQKPERVIADRAYDSDPLRQRLRKRGIELIVPYRDNNQHRRYEDGRKLRRYKRRWIVERTNAWLGQFRRLLVRHDHLLCIYRAFFYLACFWITLRRYL